MLSGKNKYVVRKKINVVTGKIFDVRKNNNAKEKMSGKNMVSEKKINVVRKNKMLSGKNNIAGRIFTWTIPCFGAGPTLLFVWRQTIVRRGRWRCLAWSAAALVGT